MDVKVNGTDQVNLESTPQKTKKTGDDSFKFQLLGKIEASELQDKLTGMMADITAQGDKIAKHMDVRDMRDYRQKIKEFMNEVVANSHQFSRENFLDRRGRHRVYGIVKLVDKNLDDLAQELIKEEKDHMAILGKVDDIRGLLLDMII